MANLVLVQSSTSDADKEIGGDGEGEGTGEREAYEGNLSFGDLYVIAIVYVLRKPPSPPVTTPYAHHNDYEQLQSKPRHDTQTV